MGGAKCGELAFYYFAIYKIVLIMKLVYVNYQQQQFKTRGITNDFQSYKRVLRRSIRDLDEDGGHIELVYYDQFGHKNTINDNPSYLRMTRLIRERNLQKAKIKLKIVSSSEEQPEPFTKNQIPQHLYLQEKKETSSDSQCSQPPQSSSEDQLQTPKAPNMDDSQASNKEQSEDESEESKQEIPISKEQGERVQSEEQSSEQQDRQGSQADVSNQSHQQVKSEEEQQEGQNDEQQIKEKQPTKHANKPQEQDQQSQEQDEQDQSQEQEQQEQEEQAEGKERQQVKHAQNEDSEEQSEQQESNEEQSSSSQSQSSQQKQQIPPPQFEEQTDQVAQPKHQVDKQNEKIEISEYFVKERANQSQQLQSLLQQSGKEETKGLVYSLQDRQEQIQHHPQQQSHHYSPKPNQYPNESLQIILQEIRKLKEKVASLQQLNIHRHEPSYTVCNGCGLCRSKGVRKAVRGVNLCIFFCEQCDSKYDIVLKNNQ